ncbi:transmembrane protein 266-like [Anguilla rostrata]|uniref:Ion transport domain-containing protein n=1 Tax=Anguilla anguilla TaxID=7936 RepID=A0A9D3RR25_ANGAN|nr:transmembrane protein 266-like [Anguilla anguilla]XP_035252235.1 transmembrane protein 266-like [Anguilla anguilla]KAG5839670.1 hypothetical protein ANANG_G00207400 [Anguilla anguilla]
MTNPQAAQQAGVSDLEIISQQAEEESQCVAPVQLVGFTYRDLPLAALDLSLAGSQLLSNLDEEDTREGSNWLKPCCGRRAALWQVFLLSAGFNCFLVACVVLVVLLLALELLIDTKLLQFSSAFQFASIIHWISLVILSVFFSETVFRIVVLGIWDYIENKVEVFDGAVIILSLAPMVASTVANGPSSPWDAISLIITLRIWRVKRIIDAYILQVKVEMELEIQQYEKAKAVREDQLDRLTQICQEQAFEIRQLRAHLAQQDLDLVAEREAAMQIHRVWDKQSSSFRVVDGLGPGESDDEGHGRIRDPAPPAGPVVCDDMNNYISQYYSEPSSDVGVPDMGARVITTAAIDVHLPDNPSQPSSVLRSADTPGGLERTGSSVSDTSFSASRSTPSFSTRGQSLSSHTLGSTTDCSSSTTTAREPSSLCSGPQCRPPPYRSAVVSPGPGRGPRDPTAVVQELLSSLSGDSCLAQKGLDPVNLKLPSPAGSAETSPEMEHRLNIYNRKNQDGLAVLQTKPLIHLQASEPPLGEKYRLLGPADSPLGHLPDT